MICRYLSHRLASPFPVYGNSRANVDIESVKSISRGDSANVFRFTMENHWGTHVDTPAHFFDGALTITGYPPEHWLFDHPTVMDVPAAGSELIGVERLLPQLMDDHTDLLLIRTGFQSLRGDTEYCTDNPGMAPEVGPWLRVTFPSIRAIGFDFISLSAYRHREQGRLAHRAFLDPAAAGSPILIVEDMDLCGDLGLLARVIVAPLLLEGIDSAPCTVIGILS